MHQEIMAVRRVRLNFANTQVEFIDRERALEQVREWAERSTFPVQVIYGPELRKDRMAPTVRGVA